MAFVFGMEGVPVFEMLFVLLGLMLLGFIFILLELRKLTRIISDERKLMNEEAEDIHRFELDLDKLERGDSKKPSQELIAYIRTAVEKGLSEDEIETSLAQAGWSKKQVADIIASIKK